MPTLACRWLGKKATLTLIRKANPGEANPGEANTRNQTGASGNGGPERHAAPRCSCTLASALLRRVSISVSSSGFRHNATFIDDEVTISDLSVFVQDATGADFRLVRRFPLTG